MLLYYIYIYIYIYIETGRNTASALLADFAPEKKRSREIVYGYHLEYCYK